MTELLVVPSELERAAGRLQASADQVRSVVGTLLPAVGGVGAAVGDADGKPLRPPRVLHVVLPRSDYTIVEDSWNVVGLSGTGSKDVVVRGAFVPDYRTISADEVAEGELAAERAGRTDTVYRLPFWSMFPLGLTAAVIGITEGLLR